MATMVKPTFTVEQMVTSSDASKKFGEIRKKAKEHPQFITENGTVETVLIGYRYFEEMYERLMELEEKEEERTLLERIDRLERNPAAAKSWKDIRRSPQ